ncbi:MAG TPA: Ig-like domain-containing protein, partial [Solirubrobacteraceae bacterium]
SWSTGSSGPQLEEGTYTLQAEQSDEAGNTGVSAPTTFTIKTKSPAVSLTPLTTPTNNSTPSFSGAAGNAAGDGASVTLKIYSGTTASGSPLRTLSIAKSGATWASGPVASLPDGTYTAQAEQSDEASDIGVSAPSTFTVDTTKPSVQIASPANGSFIKVSKPTISGTTGNVTGDQATVTVNIYSGLSVSGSPTQTLNLTRSGGAWSTGSSGPQLAEGTYTLQAEQSDEAGNTGVSAPTTFTIKTKSPAVSLTAVPTPTNDSTPTFGGAAGNAAGDVASVTLRIYSGTNASGSALRTLPIATSGATWATGPVASLPDGTYTAQVEQPDEAGNPPGKSAPSTFTIDATKPIVTITSPANGSFIKVSKPTISGTTGNVTGDQATVTVNVYSGSSITASPTQTLTLTRTGGSWTTGGSGPQLAEGPYTLQAEQSDEAGNTGVSPPTTITIKPKAPAVGLAAVATPTNNPTPSFSGAAGNAAGDIGSVKLKIYSGTSASGSALRTLSLPTSGATWISGAVKTLADGTYTAQAEQPDEAGNTGISGSSTFTIDTLPPAVTLSPGSSERHTSRPIFTGSAGVATQSTSDVPSVTLKFYKGPTTAGKLEQETSITPNGTKWTGAPSAGLENGTYTVQAEQRDEAENVGRSLPATFTVFSSGPVVTLTPLAKVSNEPKPIFGGTAGVAVDDTPVSLRVYAGSVLSPATLVGEAPATVTGGAWRTVLPAALTDGAYTAVAEQADHLGNTGSARASFTIDTISPAVTLTSPANGSSTASASVSVQGAAGTAVGDAPTVSVDLIAGSNPAAAPLQTRVIAVASEQWHVTFEGLAPGTYTTRAEQSDEAGNTGRAGPVTFTVLSLATASSPPQPPGASFTWQPSAPHTGEPVSLLSSSTDPSSPLTGFAWDLLGTGPLNAGPATISTSFSTPGNHLVRLRVVAADGLSAVAAETIPVAGPALPLMQPFPVVRIVSADTASGIKLKLLRVLAPAGARIGVICRNRGCPVKSLAKIASAKSAVSAYTFPALERPLRAGVVLEVRISRAGQIGKYTRLVVRRGRLPQRVDLCVEPAGVKAIACPAS